MPAQVSSLRLPSPLPRVRRVKTRPTGHSVGRVSTRGKTGSENISVFHGLSRRQLPRSGARPVDLRQAYVSAACIMLYLLEATELPTDE